MREDLDRTEVVPETHLHHFGLQSCTCDATIWNYNRLPEDQVEAKCIGGCGGNRFQIQYYNTTVRKIQVWWKETDFVAIALTFFNGFTNHYGSKLTEEQKAAKEGQGYAYASFEFQRGEKLTGDISICGNGKGKKTGYLKFQTSLGNTFEAGQKHNEYKFASNDAFLAGFYGAADEGIDRLGVILYKPIKEAKFTDIKWPEVDAEVGDLKKNTKDLNLCNDSDSLKEEKYSFRRARGAKHALTFDTSFAIDDKVTIEAALPQMVKSQDTFTWQMSKPASITAAMDQLESIPEEIPVKVKPHSAIKGEFSWTEGVIAGLPFTATYNVTFTDESKHDFKFDGFLDQVVVSEFEGKYKETSMAPGQACILVQSTADNKNPNTHIESIDKYDKFYEGIIQEQQFKDLMKAKFEQYNQTK